MSRIYLDNAATTPLLPSVFDAMLPFLREQYGNPSSTHAEGRRARAAVELARKTIAQAIGATPGELYFTSGGTEANNTALKTAVRDLGVRRIISSPIEHACVLQTCLHLRDCYGIDLQYVRLDGTGRADLADLERLLEEGKGQPTLVSLMHANNEIGTLNDLEAIGRLCTRHQALFHADTIQTIGHFPLNAEDLPVHFLSGSAHKLHGPKGIGFLYMRRRTGGQALLHGGGQERQLRSGTENVAGIVGLGKAVELACAQLETHRNHIEALRRSLIEQLQARFPGVRFNGDYQGEYLYTVLSVSLPSALPTAMLLFRLDLAGISASGGSACSSGANKGSHVLQCIGADTSRPTVRFSFSQLNTQADIDRTVEALAQILAEQKAVVGGL